MEVKFERLHFGYNRKREILHGIDLNLPSNKFIAVLGPNGCGKTTLVKQINRILRAQSGTVQIGDRQVSQLEPSELAKLIAYVPQMTSGVMNGSVMDTVMLGRRPYIQWKPTDEDLEIVAKALIRLNISHLSQRLFNQLSGGQKQTVLIARALAQVPDIYLFDEPVSFLDVKNQLEIMAIGRELVEQDGKTVIMVLHDLNMALRFADHVVIMKDGNVFAQGAPRDVITEENILAVYGTHAEIKNGEYVITSL
ncbi:MAG: ABC transporter ATP-binding protein [Bacteroidaceae bacterium]|jgi:iron complex transport system ATP-binding protein|nr:ABC transporter ATP-binding protein [Bacteroidaceae bacterium]